MHYNNMHPGRMWSTFYLLFGFLAATFRSFLRGQDHSLVVNQFFFSILIQEPCSKVGLLSMARYLVCLN